MKLSTDLDDYYYYPFKRDQGETNTYNYTPNIGGIDLINHPELIDNILETKGLPELKQMLIEMNAPDSPYMTLGCANWLPKDTSCPITYLEFSFRDIDIANNLQFISQIDKLFLEWLHSQADKLKVDPDILVQQTEQRTHWEYRPFSYYGSKERNLICVEVSSRDLYECDLIYNYIRIFLMKHLVLPST